MIKLNAYGRPLALERVDDAWRVFYLGAEGKRRPARDIEIPADIGDPDAAIQFIADLLHAWSSERHPDVHIID